MFPVKVKVRLGAYMPKRPSTDPGEMELLSLPSQLRVEKTEPMPNRADRRKKRKEKS